MHGLTLVLVSLVPGTEAYAQEYQFPKGFPLKSTEVEWYTATKECQDGHGKWKHVSQQSWNQERPWINGGLERSPNAKTFKFFKQGYGHVQEWTETERYFTNGGYYRRWAYPKGTVFGEVIQADGHDVEIFTLEFTGAIEPVFHRWRPFRNRAEIAPFIVGERVTRGRFQDRARQPALARTRFMERVGNAAHVIDVEGLVHEIDLSTEGIIAIRAQPWKDVIDVPFSEQDGLKSFSFTTQQRHSVVPAESMTGFFSSTSCMTCHRTAGAEGRLLDPRPTPDKYGSIRGGGFVFSLNRRR
jgi:hypothetical protein